MGAGRAADVARRKGATVVVGGLRLASVYQSSWGADEACMERHR